MSDCSTLPIADTTLVSRIGYFFLPLCNHASEWERVSERETSNKERETKIEKK